MHQLHLSFQKAGEVESASIFFFFFSFLIFEFKVVFLVLRRDNNSTPEMGKTWKIFQKKVSLLHFEHWSTAFAVNGRVDARKEDFQGATI